MFTSLSSMLCVTVHLSSGDGASSVGSGGSDESQLSQHEMAEAIKINEEIEKTGMYFA